MTKSYCILATLGNQNSNLDDNNFDKKHKLCVVRNHSGFKSINNETTVLEISDILEMFKSSEIDALEMLFAKDLIINNDYKSVRKTLLSKRNEITKLNLPSLYESCLTKSTEWSDDFFVRMFRKSKSYGLSAMNAYKYLDILYRFHKLKFENFQDALWYTGEDRELLLKMKNEILTPPEIDYLIDGRLHDLEIVKKDFYEGELKQNLFEQLKSDLEKDLGYDKASIC